MQLFVICFYAFVYNTISSVMALELRLLCISSFICSARSFVRCSRNPPPSIEFLLPLARSQLAILYAAMSRFTVFFCHIPGIVFCAVFFCFSVVLVVVDQVQIHFVVSLTISFIVFLTIRCFFFSLFCI